MLCDIEQTEVAGEERIQEAHQREGQEAGRGQVGAEGDLPPSA
jgi:hypothetical protein